jgi:hypothetical protein
LERFKRISKLDKEASHRRVWGFFVASSLPPPYNPLMCGRYTRKENMQHLAELLGLAAPR